MSTVHIMHLCSFLMRAHAPKRKKGAAFAAPLPYSFYYT